MWSCALWIKYLLPHYSSTSGEVHNREIGAMYPISLSNCASTIPFKFKYEKLIKNNSTH